ncbi:DNA repair exonuclease SbcCD nuclease subunit [Natronoarchaeum philippinense]|uniref:DNA double-strand break repair protein Mre11 n=1 Tax=Natronoarchaeum philippinense TaxID=558529 RepID=A0A285NZZ6_NATPI|nr:DNA double-strand break repair protein Mre11 [Natronoarchaeum philippinense]SNZ13476.1 DNA repair exonuclease SbcCD nuclease subunit [Natronoarchaeum philippinense]
MTRVIHTGDTHIGYRQYHSPERRRDFLDAFRGVVADAIEDDVDAVVHAGDLFHDRRPELRDLQGTVAALRDLADADVPFLAVVGNHETKRDGQWLDLFEDLGLATRLGASPELIGDTAFYGLDFVPESRRGDLDYEFEQTDADHRALVSHGLFEPFAHADWDTETVLDESNVAFDAVLLGDNHAPGKKELEGAWVTYCGSTERASASERDDRGYNVVRFENADAAGTEAVSITRRAVADTREFRFVDVELADGEGTERVRERVREHDVEDAVVIVTVEGEGEEITPAAVEEVALERGAMIARVNDRREIDDQSDVSVSFADPDDAVRERLRDLGLSSAARDIDEAVRESKVADSNVRETVETQIRERLDDGLDAFEGVAEPDGEDAAAESAATDGGDDEPRGDDADTAADSDGERVADDTSAADADTAADEPTESADDESQSSMEEYL